MIRMSMIAAFGMFIISAGSGLAQQKSPWPADAKVYFIKPKDGAVVSNPVHVVMGLGGLGVAPAGVEKEKMGHHHILVDVPELPKGEAALNPLPADDNYRHFCGGQTETQLTLKPSQRTLQLLVGDHNHVPLRSSTCVGKDRDYSEVIVDVRRGCL